MALANPVPRVTPNLRLTPTRSPSFRAPSKSPIKLAREEQCLELKQVIGSTSSSNNAFDSCEATRSFAFAAGGAAILATLDHELNITQRFFRAKPTSQPPINVTNPVYDSPIAAYSSSQPARRGSLATLREGAASITSPISDSLDSPSTRAAAARERTKAAACVSLSSDGKFIAVGETGYRPRVLIFSTAKGAPTDVPLTVLSEHSYGVKCVAFSPDGQFLASLGEVTDGFLYIWSVSSRTGSASILANNKCTSNVKYMCWMGNTLVTLGVRFIKVWRIDASARSSPSKRFSELPSFLSSPSRALAGRNCLLGTLLEKTFTCGVAIGPSKAIVCTDQGDVCLLDDTEGTALLTKVGETGFGIQACSLHLGKTLVTAGAQGELKGFPVDDLTSTKSDRESGLIFSDESFRPVNLDSDIIASTSVAGHFLCLDNRRTLQILRLTVDQRRSLSGCALIHHYPAHGGAVLGIQSFDKLEKSDIRFLTYSADGDILFWNQNGVCVKNLQVPLDQNGSDPDGLPNELKTVRASSNLAFIVTGDKFGVMRLIKTKDKRQVFDVKAHSGEITSIAIHEEKNATALIASAARDRIVQLFKYRAGTVVDHMQTLDEHIGAVTGVTFSDDGKWLVSCSSDRTVVVRERLQGRIDGKETTVFLLTRTLTLKAAPLSVDLSAGTGDSLLVSTIDRTLTIYDIKTGGVTNSFKTSDGDGGDAVIMSQAVHVEISRGVHGYAGLSGTDKSIRVYDTSGRLVGREYGHTEGMSGIALMKGDGGAKANTNNKSTLITAATDGTVFVWNLAYGVESLPAVLEDFKIPDRTSSMVSSSSGNFNRPPLRKVLSSSEILQLQSSTSREHDFGAALVRARSRSPRRRPSLKPIPDFAASLPPRPSSAAKASSPPATILERPEKEEKVAKPSSNAIGRVTEATSRRMSRVAAAAAAMTSTATAVGRTSTGTRQSSPESAPAPVKYQAQTLRSKPQSTMSNGTAKLQQRKSMSNLRSSTSSSKTGSASVKDLNELTIATEQICRSLHLFRKKLATSSDVLPLDNVRELERELSTTARALADKAARNETAMVKLLDQYSERLLSILDEKIASSVEQQFRRSRQSTPTATENKSDSNSEDDDTS